MRVAVGSDHRGLEMKADIVGLLSGMGHESRDFGAHDTQSVDYPDIAQAVCCEVNSGNCERGILICGTGLGMSIAANKTKGIRAALCCDIFMAERARQHNDANVLCLGAEKTECAAEIVRVFMTTAFEGGRHQRRLDKIHKLEENQNL